LLTVSIIIISKTLLLRYLAGDDYLVPGFDLVEGKEEELRLLGKMGGGMKEEPRF